MSTRTCERGRIYLPADELAAHDVDRDVLMWCHDQPAHRRAGAPRAGRAARRDPAHLRAMRATGIALLAAAIATCVAAALTLYSEILDRIEATRLRRLQPARHRRHRPPPSGRRRRAVQAWAAACCAHDGSITMDRWQYLFVLAACLAITAPLEIFGRGVYRQPGRTARAVLPVAAVFVVWDAIAIAAHVWTLQPAYVTGIELPGSLPIEELLFFVVIPVVRVADLQRRRR